ncbi:cysteine hydrolase [Tuanshanicoccus lijuaniae]|uniref:cysteine hydrolase family protein n=1 Tax=Aerococcaceae bacterium zg-1292 TaxID=2774330 RepID=UPI0019387FBC|nr:cysteine hydrolase [Aerococcaceae bacterium zg-1292]QQA36611.1 cysteine hydrolase [Aerococcaceae bacterium zg-1292]
MIISEKPNYTSALIVIDMIYDFVDPNGKVYYENNRKILPNIINVIKKARKSNALIIYVQHSHRKDKYDEKTLQGRKNSIEGTGGDELVEDLPIDYEKDYIIKKRRYSAFYYTDLDLILREHGIQKIYIVGTKTNNCVRSTVEDGYHLNYKVNVIQDCVATDNEEVNKIYLYDINRYYGKVIHSSEIYNS